MKKNFIKLPRLFLIPFGFPFGLICQNPPAGGGI